LEQLWNGLATTYDADIRCGYVLGKVDCEQGSNIYARVWAEHGMGTPKPRRYL